MTDIELVSCEVCDADADVEACTIMSEGGWLCPKCQAGARESFRTCDHQWIADNRDGDEGRFCQRCSHFVALEDFPVLFGRPAPTEQEMEAARG